MRKNAGLIFNQSVYPSKLEDGLPLMAAVIMGRKKKLRDYCFCTVSPEMKAFVGELTHGITKPSELVNVVDNLLRLAE